MTNNTPYGTGQAPAWPSFGDEPGGIERLSLDELVDAWLSPDRPFWAINELSERVYGKPDVAWSVICRAVEHAETDGDLGDIGVSLLEDFVQAYADRYIDQIEELAARNAKFARALTIVWFTGNAGATSERLRALRCIDTASPPMPTAKTGEAEDAPIMLTESEVPIPDGDGMLMGTLEEPREEDRQQSAAPPPSAPAGPSECAR